MSKEVLAKSSLWENCDGGLVPKRLAKNQYTAILKIKISFLKYEDFPSSFCKNYPILQHWLPESCKIRLLFNTCKFASINRKKYRYRKCSLFGSIRRTNKKYQTTLEPYFCKRPRYKLFNYPRCNK